MDEDTKRGFESVVTLIQQLGNRMDERFDAVDRRFEAVDRRFEAVESRLDRIETRMSALEFQVVAIHRGLDGSGQAVAQLLATQSAQQKAIDDLVARVTRLEHERRQQP